MTRAGAFFMARSLLVSALAMLTAADAGLSARGNAGRWLIGIQKDCITTKSGETGHEPSQPRELQRDEMTGTLQAINQTSGTILCERLQEARGVTGKSRGLLGRDRLEADEGMLFEAGRLEPFMWMHMLFMRFAIDIVFLDRDGRVRKINHQLRPWRFSSIVWGARKALELPAGAAMRGRTRIGDQIVFKYI